VRFDYGQAVLHESLAAGMITTRPGSIVELPRSKLPLKSCISDIPWAPCSTPLSFRTGQTSWFLRVNSARCSPLQTQWTYYRRYGSFDFGEPTQSLETIIGRTKNAQNLSSRLLVTQSKIFTVAAFKSGPRLNRMGETQASYQGTTFTACEKKDLAGPGLDFETRDARTARRILQTSHEPYQEHGFQPYPKESARSAFLAAAGRRGGACAATAAHQRRLIDPKMNGGRK